MIFPVITAQDVYNVSSDGQQDCDDRRSPSRSKTAEALWEHVKTTLTGKHLISALNTAISCVKNVWPAATQNSTAPIARPVLFTF